ncbi:MAG: hypothetical protein ACLR3X_11065 [Intestinibacter bartlettii]
MERELWEHISELAKLERDGCVIKETTENGHQKIVYTITNDGREVLKEWLKDL